MTFDQIIFLIMAIITIVAIFIIVHFSVHCCSPFYLINLPDQELEANEIDLESVD